MSVSELPVALVLALALLAPVSAEAPATVTIINVSNYRFTPKPIQLAGGRPITITFVNQAGGGHDFTAKEFFAASTIMAGAAPDGKISLAPHETKSITLAPRAGTYEAHCSHFLHASMGMTDEIVVS